MRQLGINLGARKEMDLPTFCAFIRDLGFSRVFSGSTEPDKVRAQAETVHKAGLCYDTLHAPFKKIINHIWYEGDEGEDTLRQLMTCVDLCAEVAAPIAVVHLSAGENAPPPTDVGRGRFIRLVEYAAMKGVKIAFENQRKLGNIGWAFEEFKDAPTWASAGTAATRAALPPDGGICPCSVIASSVPTSTTTTGCSTPTSTSSPLTEAWISPTWPRLCGARTPPCPWSWS